MVPKAFGSVGPTSGGQLAPPAAATTTTPGPTTCNLLQYTQETARNAKVANGWEIVSQLPFNCRRRRDKLAQRHASQVPEAALPAFRQTMTRALLTRFDAGFEKHLLRQQNELDARAPSQRALDYPTR